jgi:hypothetical protein
MAAIRSETMTERWFDERDDDPAEAHIHLTEAQRRSLTTGVRHLWQNLDDLEVLLDAPRSGPFLVVENDLPVELLPEIRNLIAGCRTDLQALAGLLAMERQRRSVRPEFAALAASAWTIAEDLHPTRLGRYGPVDADAAAQLAPVIQRLAAALLKLTGAADAATVPPHGSNSHQ